MKIDIKTLFSKLCCSRCKSDFDENAVKILKNENGLCTIQLVCQKCGKDFGIGLLNLPDTRGALPLEVVEGLKPVSTDDVIDAHEFIRDLDSDWQKYLPEKD